MVSGLPDMAKVLVIDDEANLRKVLAALLRRDGYDVTIAEDGGDGAGRVPEERRRRGDHRSGDAQARRDGSPPGGERRRPRGPGDHHHRPRRPSTRPSRRSSSGRSTTSPSPSTRASSPTSWPRRSAPTRPPGAAPGVERGTAGAGRRVVGDAGGAEDHRQGGRHALHGAHHRRERHRQGAGRHRPPRGQLPPGASPSSRSTARRSPRT